MNEICDIVAERVALGEPLGDAADHAASCPRCRRLAALPAELGKVHGSEADPGLGFSARMTAGAQHRVVVRRRRRVAAGLATAVAATTLGVFVVTREPAHPSVAVQPATDHAQPAAEDHEKHDQPDPWKDPADQPSADDDVRALVHLANVDHSAHLSARWNRIEKPLRPYRAVVKGTEP